MDYQSTKDYIDHIHNDYTRRIGIVADTHIGARKFRLTDDGGTNRFAAATYWALNQLQTTALAANLDTLIILGDVFDTANPHYMAVEKFRQFLSTMTSNGVDVYCLYGNHDKESRKDCVNGPIETAYEACGIKNDWATLPPKWTVMNYAVDKAEYQKQKMFSGKVLLCHDEISDNGMNENICGHYDFVYSGHIHGGGKQIINRFGPALCTTVTFVSSPIGGKYNCDPGKMYVVNEFGVNIETIDLSSITWIDMDVASNSELQTKLKTVPRESVVRVNVYDDSESNDGNNTTITKEEIAQMQATAATADNIYTFIVVEHTTNSGFMKRQIEFWDAVHSDHPSWTKELEEILHNE